MDPFILSALGFLMAIVSGGINFFLLSAKTKTEQALHDVTSKSRKQIESVNNEIKKLQEKLNKSRENQKDADKARRQAQSKEQELQREITDFKTHIAELKTKQRLQKDIDEEQIASLQTQLNEALSEGRARAKAWDDKQKEDSQQRQTQSQQIEQRLKDTQQKCRELEKTNRQLTKQLEQSQERLKKINPRDVIVSRKRSVQHAKLYDSIKGLRDAAEERSTNWETALTHLSRWVLAQTHSKKGQASAAEETPTAIGPLVGSALEAIGKDLVQDAFSHHPTSADTHQGKESKEESALANGSSQNSTQTQAQPDLDQTQDDVTEPSVSSVTPSVDPAATAAAAPGKPETSAKEAQD